MITDSSALYLRLPERAAVVFIDNNLRPERLAYSLLSNAHSIRI